MIRDSHRGRWLFANALLAGVILASVLLFFDPPGSAGFWPACPIHRLLGIECPGCGATRALAALMHGRVLQALRWNALFVLLLPFGIAGATQVYRRALRPERFVWPNPPIAAIYSVVAVSLAFTAVRNLIH